MSFGTSFIMYAEALRVRFWANNNLKKIDKQFNTLSLKEYFFFNENLKIHTDFITLGSYRSIIENEKLTSKEKLELRDFANSFSKKLLIF
jgi:hypothetical protein